MLYSGFGGQARHGYMSEEYRDRYIIMTRDGTAEPVSRDQILRHARGQGNVHFTCSADHEQDWQPYPVDPYSAICDDHTYIYTYNIAEDPSSVPQTIQDTTVSSLTELKQRVPDQTELRISQIRIVDRLLKLP